VGDTAAGGSWGRKHEASNQYGSTGNKAEQMISFGSCVEPDQHQTIFCVVLIRFFGFDLMKKEILRSGNLHGLHGTP